MTANVPDGPWSMLPRIVAAGARAIVVTLSLGRVRREGLGDLPADGPLIVVANHISNVDPPFVGGWLAPALRRRPHFLAKDVLFRGPAGALLRYAGVIPVRAGGSDMEAYRAARAILEAGGVVVIFPEGTRSPTAELGTARPGVALLATRTGVPVLPVGVSNTDRLLGRGRRWPRFGTPVTLRVGQPFRLTADPALPRREALAKANDEMMRRVSGLLDPRHRGAWEAWPQADAAD